MRLTDINTQINSVLTPICSSGGLPGSVGCLHLSSFTCSALPSLIPIKPLHLHVQEAKFTDWLISWLTGASRGQSGGWRYRYAHTCTFIHYSDAYTCAYSNGLLIKGAVLLTKALNLSVIRSGRVEVRDMEREWRKQTAKYIEQYEWFVSVESPSYTCWQSLVAVFTLLLMVEGRN